MYVYQITNQVNNKSYIGITNNYKKRWSNECSYPSNPEKRQVIQSAIHAYGKDNFIFKILYSGLSIEDAIAKEEELIKELNTLVPNGYNVSPGGEYHPTPSPQYGEKNGMAKITDKEAQYILDNRDKPLYVLYEDFVDKISYTEFKAIYNGQKFKHLTTTTPIYPYNREFSSQFVASKIDYGDVVSLRKSYANGVYWRDAYEEYKEIYPNEWSFWAVYNGKRFPYVMPEVFTQKLKSQHHGTSKLGSKNGRAVLTEDNVRDIRIKHKEGYTNKQLYELYNQVDPSTIRSIINNKTWKNVII